uniref:15 kDa calcium-binding protein n=1 Tax=Hemicentrotus pulcherrimus TaxID=7650 RepID=SP15_HEMPU|nr:RecName: Full=15 kDa calcium-binding protein; Short=CABP [Hemicentrotus pulcherrimus]
AVQLVFTDAEKAEFKFGFKSKDGDNSITAKELGEFLESAGKSFSEEQLAQMISDVDTDKSGTIEFSEMLMGIAEKMMKWTWKKSHFQKAFDDMDKDGNGVLSPEELHLAMSTRIEPPMSKEAIDAIIAKADCDGDGKINRKEFVKLIKSS